MVYTQLPNYKFTSNINIDNISNYDFLEFLNKINSDQIKSASFSEFCNKRSGIMYLVLLEYLIFNNSNTFLIEFSVKSREIAITNMFLIHVVSLTGCIEISLTGE